MIVKLFNFWYFFWIILTLGVFLGLYFLLRNKSKKIQKWTLFSILAFALLLHFLKAFIPPYSFDSSKLNRDIWFINICAANIALFPFIFLSKSERAKDYMFYIGVISGILATLYPEEPMAKADQQAEILDIIRFYIHHGILWIVPMLMVTLKLHTISYKRIFSAPIGLLVIMLFIMLNQILQSELGFVSLRNQDFLDINYRNNSFIWGPGDHSLAQIFVFFCPQCFRVVPVGEFAGQQKFWPWFWLIIPVFVLVTPLAFGICMIFDRKNFIVDIKSLLAKVKARFSKNKS